MSRQVLFQEKTKLFTPVFVTWCSHTRDLLMAKASRVVVTSDCSISNFVFKSLSPNTLPQVWPCLQSARASPSIDANASLWASLKAFTAASSPWGRVPSVGLTATLRIQDSLSKPEPYGLHPTSLQFSRRLHVREPRSSDRYRTREAGIIA